MTRRPILWDLFCGGGGTSVGYSLAGFDVIGVDVIRRPDYPFPVILADATTIDLSAAAAVHASPPCKLWTIARKVAQSRLTLFDPWEDLLTPTLERFADLSIPWVVENVPGSPMPADSVTYCGSSFGLLVRRHRLFASNIRLDAPPCRHEDQPLVLGVYGTGGDWKRTAPGGGGEKVSGERAARALGVDWTIHQPSLSQMVPPAYTRHIGTQLLEHIRAAA
jgi:hypothetical protein